ncbi:hypothetical protein H5410_025693 [Solanum commersonii]|uniref:Uncharacterized protein n=1 Tax=Solanum commersonii TaxID=4109 RepID=A0A9J5YUH2_SOLCO|nr:hypothetical protein H5410_025693 [Solanum commersonii]
MNTPHRVSWTPSSLAYSSLRVFFQVVKGKPILLN